MPVSGDTLRFSTAILDNNILSNYQRNGANLTWNFDSLRVISQGVQRFVNSSQTPYTSVPANRLGILFADTISLGPNSVNDVYNFINSSTTDFSIDYRAASIPTGIALFPIFLMQNSYSDKDEVFQFPLDYQDRDSSTFNFVFNNAFPPLYYGSSGYRINEVDAWGTLSTPYGTFNTLRIITDMVSMDTISFSGQNISIPSHVRTYQWIANGERIPVMTVNGLVIAGTFVPNSVEYRDSSRVFTPLIPSIAIFTADTTVVDLNDTLGFTNLSIGGLGLTHEWSFNPNNVVYRSGNSASRNIEVSFTDTGFYDVQLIVSAGTSKDTLLRENYIKVLGSNGIQSVNNELLNRILLSPNPAKLGHDLVLRVENEIDLIGYEVVDVQGKVIERVKVMNKRSVRLKAPVTSGIYFYKVITRQGSIVKKIIVE
tara:strand:- start:1073 stop:2353 length:1281 start_codon:yes stop_codon:yes gene_type:complete